MKFFPALVLLLSFFINHYGGEATHTVYNHNGIRKAVSIPACSGALFTLDGKLNELKATILPMTVIANDGYGSGGGDRSILI